MKTAKELETACQANLKKIIAALLPSPEKGAVELEEAEDEYVQKLREIREDKLDLKLRDHRFFDAIEAMLRSVDFTQDEKEDQTILDRAGNVLGLKTPSVENIDLRQANSSQASLAIRNKDALVRRAVSAVHAFLIALEGRTEIDIDGTKKPYFMPQAYQALRVCLEKIDTADASTARAVDRLRENALKELNNKLAEFLKIGISLRKARKCLQAGEELVTWEQRGVKPIATVIPRHNGNTLVVIEQPIVNHAVLVERLAFLDDQSKQAPEWFKNLNIVKQAWLKKNRLLLKSFDQVDKQWLLSKVPSLIDVVTINPKDKFLAEALQFLDTPDKAAPSWFANDLPATQKWIRKYHTGRLTILSNDQKFWLLKNIPGLADRCIGPKNLEQAIKFLKDPSQKIPDWFKNLTPVEQAWLHGKRLACPSSLTNDIPGLANYGRHICAIYNADGELILRYESIRRRTPAPMSVKDAHDRQEFANENVHALLGEANPVGVGEQFWEDLAFARDIGYLHEDQSLLSPILSKWSPIDFLSSLFISYQENNTIMRDTAQRAFEEARKVPEAAGEPLTIFTGNYPINLMRFLSHGIEYNQQAMQEKIALMGKACGKIADALEKKGQTDAAQDFMSILTALQTKDLAGALTIIVTAAQVLYAKKETWGPELFEHDTLAKSTMLCMGIEAIAHSYALFAKLPSENGNNLSIFSAAYSRLMIQGFGGTVSGGCKSAKDREAVVQLHTDAMAVFYAEKGYLPQYTDLPGSADRKRFVEIMADLFDAEYEQYAASLNAFGCFGIQDGVPSWMKFLFKVPLLGKWLNNHRLIPQDLRDEIIRRHPEEYQSQQSIAKTRKLDISKRKPIGETLREKIKQGPWKTFRYIAKGTLRFSRKALRYLGLGVIQAVWLPFVLLFQLGQGSWNLLKGAGRALYNNVLQRQGKPPLLPAFVESVQASLPEIADKSEPEVPRAKRESEVEISVKDESEKDVESSEETPLLSAFKTRSDSFEPGKTSIFPPPSRFGASSDQEIKPEDIKAVLEAICKEKNLDTKSNGRWQVLEDQHGVSIQRVGEPHLMTSMRFMGRTLTAIKPPQKYLAFVCNAMIEVMEKALGENAGTTTLQIFARTPEEAGLLAEACKGKFKGTTFATGSAQPSPPEPPSASSRLSRSL